MTRIVEITQIADSVTCNETGHADILFNVSNISASALKVGAKIIADSPAQQSWFRLEGQLEKKLERDATDQFVVNVNAPRATEGKYTVRLLVYSLDKPDEDYTKSEAVAVIVPPRQSTTDPEVKKSKWLVWLLALLAIALIGGVTVYRIFFANQEQEVKILAIMPDIRGKILDDAKIELTNLAFTDIQIERRFDSLHANNVVLEQSPEAGTKTNPEKTTITLTLADSTTTMPDLRDLILQGAKDRLAKKGFKKITIEPKYDPSKPEGTVLDQNPQAEESVSVTDTQITLIVADRKNSVDSDKEVQLFQHANYNGQSHGLSFGKYSLKDLGIGNDSLSSLKVKKGAGVRLFEHDQWQGASIDVTANTPYIGNAWNDRVSSVWIYHPGEEEVKIFMHVNYQGAKNVILFEHADWKGQKLEVNNDTPNIGSKWNDKTSSIIVN